MSKLSVRTRMPRFAALAGGIAVAVLMGACARYEAKPIDPRQSAAEFSALRLDAPQLRQGVARLLPRADQEWPPQQWDRQCYCHPPTRSCRLCS